MSSVDVEPVLVVDAARVVADADDGRAALGQLGRGDAADLAEALDDAALVGEIPAQPLARALDHHHDAGAGRLVAEHASRRCEIGLPVTISGTAWPICIEYVSIIQAIVCSFVAMSGAGMSSFGPMTGSSSAV